MRQKRKVSWTNSHSFKRWILTLLRGDCDYWQIRKHQPFGKPTIYLRPLEQLSNMGAEMRDIYQSWYERRTVETGHAAHPWNIVWYMTGPAHSSAAHECNPFHCLQRCWWVMGDDHPLPWTYLNNKLLIFNATSPQSQPDIRTQTLCVYEVWV